MKQILKKYTKCDTSITIKKLKDILDAYNIKYKKSSKKDELCAIVEELKKNEELKLNAQAPVQAPKQAPVQVPKVPIQAPKQAPKPVQTQQHKLLQKFKDNPNGLTIPKIKDILKVVFPDIPESKYKNLKPKAVLVKFLQDQLKSKPIPKPVVEAPKQAPKTPKQAPVQAPKAPTQAPKQAPKPVQTQQHKLLQKYKDNLNGLTIPKIKDILKVVFPDIPKSKYINLKPKAVLVKFLQDQLKSKPIPVQAPKQVPVQAPKQVPAQAPKQTPAQQPTGDEMTKEEIAAEIKKCLGIE